MANACAKNNFEYARDPAASREMILTDWAATWVSMASRCVHGSKSSWDADYWSERLLNWLSGIWGPPSLISRSALAWQDERFTEDASRRLMARVGKSFQVYFNLNWIELMSCFLRRSRDELSRVGYCRRRSSWNCVLADHHTLLALLIHQRFASFIDEN